MDKHAVYYDALIANRPVMVQKKITDVNSDNSKVMFEFIVPIIIKSQSSEPNSLESLEAVLQISFSSLSIWRCLMSVFANMNVMAPILLMGIDGESQPPYKDTSNDDDSSQSSPELLASPKFLTDAFVQIISLLELWLSLEKKITLRTRQDVETNLIRLC